MRRSVVFLSIVAFILIATIAGARDFQTAIERPGIDMASVTKLMKKGELLIIEEKSDGSLDLVTSGIIINAPPEKVYEVILDYGKYPEYMPSTEEVTVLKEEGNIKHVQYRIKFKFSVLKYEVTYVLDMEHFPNKGTKWDLLESKDGKIKSTYGSWQLFPIEGGRTAAFYSVYSDIKNISWIIRKIFEAEPSMEISVNASSCVMVLKSLKNRVEDPTYAPNLKKDKQAK